MKQISSSRTGETSPARKARWPIPGLGGRGWFLLWAALVAASALLTFDPKLYVNGDNVNYMNLAKAVRGGELWPSAKYPPLFPWLLAIPQSLFGLALLPQKVLVTLLYLGSGILLMRRARSLFGTPWGEPIAWIAITLVPVLEFGHYVMSEVPYLFFSLLALEAGERTGEVGKRAALIGALAAAATFYTRSVGLSLWIGLAAFLLMNPRTTWRVRSIFAAVSVALALPWLLHALLGPPNPYFKQLIRINPLYPEFGLLDAKGWAQRIGENAWIYLMGEIPTHLLPAIHRWTYDPPAFRYRFLPWFIGVLPLALALIGLFISIRRREGVGFYLLLYLILDLLWPSLWSGIRFLIPILPLLVLCLFRALFWICGLMGNRFRRRPRLAAILIGLWILLAIKNQSTLARDVRSYPEPWNSYFKAAEWVRRHTKPDDLIVERKAAMFSFATGRRTISFPREPDTKKMIAWMDREGVDYVVMTNIPYDDIKRFLIPAIVAEQLRFAPAYEVEEPYAAVLRLLPSPIDPARP